MTISGETLKKNLIKLDMELLVSTCLLLIEYESNYNNIQSVTPKCVSFPITILWLM
jgi:hypothetical protein